MADALHIRLVCWAARDGQVPDPERHEQAISAEQLRQLKIAPLCSAPVGDGICGSAIWAIKHEGEPTRYVGHPPVHEGSCASWADCIEIEED